MRIATMNVRTVSGRMDLIMDVMNNHEVDVVEDPRNTTDT